ncbi:hypothetical protein Aduo_006211 [Ancylostoma duodenale]
MRTMLPFIELPTLEDAIRFREDSQAVIDSTLARKVAPAPTQQNTLFNDVQRLYLPNNENPVGLYEDQMIRQQLLQHQQLVVGQNPDVPTTSGQHRNLGNNYQSAQPPIFRGEKEVSKIGKRPGIVNTIPGTENAYVFCFQKSTTSPGTLIYRCYNCMKQSSKYTGVHSKRSIRKDKNSRRASAQKHWHSTVGDIMRMEWEDDRQRKEVLRRFTKRGYDVRRSSYSRSVRAYRREVNMEVITEELQNLPDGSRFLHIKRPDLHLYYSEEVVQKACENGINALIGDGVHKLNPKTAPVHMEKGQLYTIHATCNGEMELPILYAVTRSKKVQTYRTIFGALKEVLDRFGAPQRLRILLDYEKAAIKAARAIFTESVVQECAFHLAQAWNRQSAFLGLRQYVAGKNMHTVPAKNSWITSKKKTWLRGTFKDLWCKWDIHELRTANSAEAFHSKLCKLLNSRIHPPFEDLLELLQEISMAALGTLLHMEAEQLSNRRNVPGSIINEYCIKMSRFVTEKRI